jgi:hypothetical protein
MAAPGWDWVEERLRGSRNYWLSTVRPDGRPYAVPIWGVWLAQRFWFTSLPSRKVENIADQPWVVLATETPGEVVILEGEATVISQAALPAGYGAAFDAKYGPGWSGLEASGALLLCMRPVHGRAWRESEAMAPPARFRFGG